MVNHEEWRPIVWAPGYEVSDHGCVRSTMPRGRSRTPLAEPHLVAPSILRSGHLCMHVSVNARQVTRTVHRLVCEAFHGPCPEWACEVRHLDGNPANNRADNLRWGTRAENEADMVRHGVHTRGTRNGNAKLSLAQVLEIQTRLSGNECGNALAAEFQVSPVTICRIRQGQRYLLETAHLRPATQPRVCATGGCGAPTGHHRKIFCAECARVRVLASGRAYMARRRASQKEAA